MCLGERDWKKKGENWFVGTEGWYFCVVEMKRGCIFTVDPLPFFFFFFSFLGHLDSCQAGTPGMGEGKKKKAVVKLFWPASRKVFQSCN
jgi:hypothetical protein